MSASFPTLHALLVVLSILTVTSNAIEPCERLQSSLLYEQKDAPRDLSGVLPVVVKQINRVLDGVVDVEVEWTGGDLQGTVGDHIVQCKVTRLASVIQKLEESETTFTDEEGRLVASQCFHVPFTILDTNECTLPSVHSMRHRCHTSALCVNTEGSYECICPLMVYSEDGAIKESASTKLSVVSSDTVSKDFWEAVDVQIRSPWEVSLAQSSCPGRPSTFGCCPPQAHKGPEATECRTTFRCPINPCTSHDCTAKATCVRHPSPNDMPNYKCRCPKGTLGSGRRCNASDVKPEPKVSFDGTPTEETLKANFCDCTIPVIDACSGFPPCKGKHQICLVGLENRPYCGCKPGYVAHEKYGCVDESPPKLNLIHDPNGDHTLRLTQGEVYQEYAVDILDENAEEYLRSLKIAYSKPLPQGCLLTMEEFHVNYTVATPWTVPPYVRQTRRVVIQDVNECQKASILAKTCPALTPHCDVEAGATCVNTMGSYKCQCPKYSEGDGFLPGASFDAGSEPEGYKGGQGCHDVGLPVIQLLGPNPKKYHVCEYSGITSVIRESKTDKDSSMLEAQQSHYEEDIKNLIRSTAGAELCASHDNPTPQAIECVRAYDQTHTGRIDLSDQVEVGEPVRSAPLRWAVPYNVKDAAGNSAATVWRDVVVIEVNFNEMEVRIRTELLEQQKVKTQKEVERALAEDRQKREDISPTVSCPNCPACKCHGQIDISKCEAICLTQSQTCRAPDNGWVVRAMLWLDNYFPPTAVPGILLCITISTIFFLLRWILMLMFSPAANRSRYYNQEEMERKLQDSVHYYDTAGAASPPPGRPTLPPPRESLSTGNRFTSPLLGDVALASLPGFDRNGLDSPFVSSGENIHDIYRSPILTPTRTSEGVLRRSPYGSGNRPSH